MKSFTNNAKRIFALLLIAALVLSFFGCARKVPEIANSYDEIYEKGEVQLNVPADGAFRIFKINDTHFINGTCKDDKKTFDELRAALNSSEFDMIIVDGDLIEGYNKKLSFNKFKAAKLFCELIEEYNVPWTFAPGNNDGQQDGTNEELIAFFMQYKNFLCGNSKGLSGSMQFFIDLVSKGKTVHSIAVMDSHSLDENGEYDHIKPDQTEWLTNEVNDRKVKTSVFFHMPTPAFKAAYENGEAYEGFPFCDKYDVDNIKENAAFDAATADNEYITLISTAHVHSDNIAYFYNGRYYQLSSLGGYSAVGSKSTKPSFTLIKINTSEDDVQKMYEFLKVDISRQHT